MIIGRATPEGTARFRARHAEAATAGHFRELSGLQVSSIGLGTYLGASTDDVDAGYTESVLEALSLGCNVFDTAPVYRKERSERVLGRALAMAFEEGLAARDEVIVCSKGGAGLLEPAPITSELDRSRASLGLECVDLYYLHNPESHLDDEDAADFLHRLEAVFSALGERRERGHIAAMGVATWEGLRRPPGAPGGLVLESLIQASGGGVMAVQAPLNLAMPEALASPTQELGGVAVPLVVAVRHLGVGLFTSASILQGQLANLPGEFAHRFPEFDTDAQRALQFTRSLPGVTCALVGMSSPRHVRENLALARVAAAPMEVIQQFFA